MGCGNNGRRPWRESRRGDGRELLGGQAEQNLRQQIGEPGFHRNPPGERAALVRHLSRHDRRSFLISAVLQQPGEQQVPGLEQGQVLLVVHFSGRKQPGRLEV